MFKQGEKEEIKETIKAILEEHGTEKENLIPLLQAVQERLGYLPRQGMEQLATALGIPAVDVYGPATFYNSFRLHPPGEHEVKVCMGTACYMVGAEIALDSFERRLQIRPGETTPDRQISLDLVACVGCCNLAPVVVVDKMVEGRVTPTRVDGLVLSLNGEIDGAKTRQKGQGVQAEEKLISPVDGDGVKGEQPS